MVEKGRGLRGFQGPGSTEVGEAAGVSAGCHQGSTNRRHAWTGEGDNWLGQAEGIGLGVFGTGMGSQVECG